MPELRSLNPATGQTIWQGQSAGDEEVRQAVVAARAKSTSWAERPLAERVAIAERFAELVADNQSELAHAISLETGKPTWEALGEVGATRNKVSISIRAHGERAGTAEQSVAGARSVVRHKPHGVVAVLGPYNFPLHLPNGHIVPSLVAGNTIVFKPSEHAPLCAEETVELWNDAGLPRGVLTLVQGGADTGRALVQSSGIDGVFFTGSASTGKRIHQHFAGDPRRILALEMGGNNPLVVDEVQDLDAAVYAIIQSAFITAGQRCTCARRLLVPRGVAGERLMARLLETTSNIKVGAFDVTPEPFMGPVISESAADDLLATQTRLQSLGGASLLEMKKLEAGTGLVSPGLVDVTDIDDLPDEEHFGPLLQIIWYKDFDEAIEIANHTRFGLAAGLLSDRRDHYDQFLARIRAGIVNWNRPLTGASSAAPFGGIGESGNHRPSAFYAVDYCVYPVASLEADVPSLPDHLSPGVSL